jgi:mRNA interferase YafQ
MTITIERTSKFKRDYKRESRTRSVRVDDLLNDFLVFQVMGEAVPVKYQDHMLTGNMNGYRECHLKPNLLLVYAMLTVNDAETSLWLVGLGSHSELYKK